MKQKIPAWLFCIALFLLLCTFPVLAFPPSVCQQYQMGNDRSTVQVAVSDDGGLIIAGSPSSGIIALLDREGKYLWAYRADQAITNVAISNDGVYVAASSVDGGVSFFNKSGILLWNFSRAGCLPQVRMTPSGSAVLIFNRNNPDRPFDQNLHIFDLNGTMISEQNDPLILNAGISGVMDYVVISLGKNSSTLVEYTESGSHGIYGYPRPGYRPAISGDGGTIAIPSPAEVDTYNPEGDHLSVFPLKGSGVSVAVSYDGNRIAAGTGDSIEVFAGNGTRLWSYRTRLSVEKVAISSKGDIVAALAFPGKELNPTFGRIYLFSGTGELLWNRTLEEQVNSLALSPDGSTVAVGSLNNTVYLFSPLGEPRAIHLNILPAQPLPRPYSLRVITYTYSPSNMSATPSRPAPVSMVFIVLATGMTFAAFGILLKK